MSGFVGSTQNLLQNLGGAFKNSFNHIMPPGTRADIVENLQYFALRNPKLAAFLATQAALTGIPLLLFLAFSLAVLLFALSTALLLGLIAAVCFTLFVLGLSLIVVLPTLFITTSAASFVFFWGLVGYYLLKWFNDGQPPAPGDRAVGDRIDRLTGGRVSWLVDGKGEKADNGAGMMQIKLNGDEENKKPNGFNGTAEVHHNGKTTGVSERSNERSG